MPKPWEVDWDEQQPARGPVQPIVRAAPKVSPMPNDYQIGQDAITNARDARRDARDDRREGNDDAKRSFDMARDMRTEFNKLTPVTDYQTVVRQFSSALKTQPNASGDQALITAYAKMLDPGSVVREQEFNTVANADSAIGKLVARLNKELGADESGMIRPEIRARVRDEMFNLTRSYRQAYEQTRMDYSRSAEAYGVDPIRVVGTDFAVPYQADIDAFQKARRNGGAGTPWQQDTVSAPGGLAGGGDGKKSIPIPAEMQAEYAQYVSQNRGRLDPDAYASFRAGLDQKYGFGQPPAAQMEGYRSEAGWMNDRTARGGNLNLTIPAPDADMTVRDQVNNSIFNNRVGAAVMAAPPLASGLDEVAGFVNSVANGTDYDVEREKADALRQRLAGDYPGSTMVGQLGGAIVGGLGATGAALRYAPRLAAAGGTLPGQLALGSVGGAATGALENNDNRLLGGAMGAGAGAGGVGLGRYVVGPAADALLRSRAADAVANTGVKAWNALTDGTAALRNAPRLSREQSAVRSVLPELTQIRTNIADAQDLGLPYALGDASPKLRALTGAVTRRSVDARELAENTFGPRNLDQGDRAIGAIENYLAPDTNLGERRQQWLKAAQNASEPLYRQANSIGIEVDDALLNDLNTAYGRDALKRAVRIAEGEGKDPFAIGFVEDGSGGLTIPGLERYERGRFQSVPAGDPREGLPSRQVRGYNGNTFVHKGPIDLATWTRQNGGLVDQNTELSHMGFTNKSRGVPFGGNDARFGPLINNNGGMTYDEAAERAWEAGYFPGPDRPSVNDFLDTLRGTQEGWGRRFLPEEEADFARFGDAVDHANNVRETRLSTGKRPVIDTSQSAGPRDFAPTDAWNPNVHDAPTFETLDLVKRGFDSRINEARNPLTGEIDFENNPELQAIDKLRQRYVGMLDQRNGMYPQARGEYERYIGNRSALDMGVEGFKPQLKPRDMTHVLSTLDRPDGEVITNGARLGEYRRGYATAMADKVRDTRMVQNPYEAIYGTSAQREKVGMLFPDAPRFDRTYQLEQDMARTARETIGGSPTAGRLEADQQLMGSSELPEQMANAVVQTGTGGGFPAAMTLARQTLGDRVKLGFGNAGIERADRLAPVLMNTNSQQEALDYLDEVARINAEIERRREVSRQIGGLLGGAVAPSFAPQW